MNKFFKLIKIILQTIFFCVFLFINQVKGIEKIYTSDSLSNYFSGVLALDNNKLKDSYDFLKKIENLNDKHSNYSKSYIEILIYNSKYYEASRYANLLRKKKLNFYESDIILVSKFIKNNQYNKAYDYLLSLEKEEYSDLEILIHQIILSWIKVEKFKLNLNDSQTTLKSLDTRFKNIKNINSVFLNCYFDSPKTQESFEKLINNKKTDFSRYTFFYVNYLNKKSFFEKANLVLNKKLKVTPRNLLLNQLKLDINNKKSNYLKNEFNCKSVSNIIAELFYITANALSSQSIYSYSNFYLHLAIFLNPDFFSYNTLLAENLTIMGNYKKAKKIYSVLSKGGGAFNWHSSKQLALIDLEQNKPDKAIQIIKNSYLKIKKPSIYQTYDYANFLKNNEKFNQSIRYYTNVIEKIPKSHELYPKAKDGRGISYEQIGEWKKAEKDFLSSLKAKPDQAYVINYLAYSWIEKGIKIEKSLKMLEEANRLRTNDGYITDSLGWALFKLQKYEEAKKILQKAVQLMPSDPIVNDHFADALWMSGKKIQARYYWKYVLKMEDAEDELKQKILNKIIKGPAKPNPKVY